MPSLCANLNDHTFRSLNLLYRVQESWVLAERGLDRLIEREFWRISVASLRPAAVPSAGADASKRQRARCSDADE